MTVMLPLVGGAKGEEEEEVQGPFVKKYFAEDMMMKYEPLADAMERVMEADGKDDDAWTEFQMHYNCYRNFEAFSQWDGNKYDIVFYGVSGYTGYLMMEYLKRISLKVNPESFTFAFAGRTPSKVRDMRDREFAGTQWEDTPILEMNYDDLGSIMDLVKSSHVIINVAGPYMLTQGELMVDCCLQLGADYLDISGEIPWTLRIIDLHREAIKKGRFLCPSSASAGGFPDLLVYLAAKKMREDYGEELRKAICYTTGGGTGAGSSGGTLATRAAMAGAGDDVRKKMADPFSLGGFIPDIDRNGVKNANVEFGTGKVTLKLRSEDLDANISKITEDKKLGIWRGPFVYSYFDTRVVRRSNAMLADMGNQPYGRSFNFMEYAMLPPEAVMAMKSGGAGAGAASVEGEKEKLKAEGKYFEQGEGPDLDTLGDAWCGFFMWAESTKGHEVKCAFIGKDGYLETARVAVETAMCLRFDRDKLPFKGGFVSPTVACGTMLVKRFIDTGLKFKMGDWFSPEECTPPEYP